MTSEIVVLDFETEMIGDYSDLCPRVIEVGAQILNFDHLYTTQKHQERPTFQCLVNPERVLLERPVTFDYTPELRQEISVSMTFDAIAPKMIEFCGERPVFAWPGSFEEWVWKSECYRTTGKTFKLGTRHNFWCLKSMTLAALHLMGLAETYSFETFNTDVACEILGIECIHTERHRAVGDVESYIQIIKELTYRITDRGLSNPFRSAVL